MMGQLKEKKDIEDMFKKAQKQWSLLTNRRDPYGEPIVLTFPPQGEIYLILVNLRRDGEGKESHYWGVVGSVLEELAEGGGGGGGGKLLLRSSEAFLRDVSVPHLQGR